MPRKSPSVLAKKTLFFRKGDLEALAEIFPGVPPSQTARTIISRVVDKYGDTPLEEGKLSDDSSVEL